MTKGYLVLETGEVFPGDWIGREREIEGEVVFNTSMTGYQEMLTDPSNKGQILTFCYPIIGSYGMNNEDNESSSIAVSAVIMSDICDEPSHYQSTRTLSDELKKNNIPGLANVDTRSLVAVIRKRGNVNGKIIKEKETNKKNEWKRMNSLELVGSVSVKKAETYGDGPNHVVLVDFGYKKSILKVLLNHGCKVTIVPYNTDFETFVSLHPDGILISNGPGNPMELKEVFPTIKSLTENYPTLGISFGHQLIALAYGGKIERLPFGHRGNYPVKDLRTGKVYMTSQNHGYVVGDGSVDKEIFQVVFQNVNDKTVEGTRHVSLPVQSVQFHPEAHPGPSDTEYIFKDFIHQVVTTGGSKYVKA